MAHLEGVGPHNRKGRLSLKTGRPSENALLAGERSDHSSDLDPVQRWGEALWAARNAWDISRRQPPKDADEWLAGGSLAARRLSKAEAANLLGVAFRVLDEGVGQ